MATEKLEYDSTLGGTVQLASHVPTFRYAAAVQKEIKYLLKSVQDPTSTKLVFQRLPKHMRRRAMSHHPKRLPRKYRLAHLSQMAKTQKLTKEDNSKKMKRPSRKHRRRPSNLLREYIRRQRRHVWLETHIWHARRFHMVERWGYRLPYASCDKTYRACYRATAEHCLLQDISFYACIQLQGRLEDLRVGFARLTSTNCGLSITAKTYISGRREGRIELFRDGQYPNGALGCIWFMWRPLMENEEQSMTDANMAERKLWIWVHPIPYKTVLEELVKVFELTSTKNVKVPIEAAEESEHDGEMEQDELFVADKGKRDGKFSPSVKQYKKPGVKAQRRLQFMTKTFAYERVKRYTNSERTLTLSELKDTMNRFRLTGPLSQSVLMHAFKVKPFKAADEPDNWFRKLLSKDKNNEDHHVYQSMYWQKCSDQIATPTELLPNIIIALNIEDPRIHRPEKRTKVLPSHMPDTGCDLELWNASSCLAQSPLWDEQLRDRICEHMKTTREYCELRKRHAVVPGAPCKFEQELQPLPVLLIQRPGSQDRQYKRQGYACGWDVIVPSGYGMPVWLSLIMRGCKPGGLRECSSIARELGTDEHFPDTVAGKQSGLERHAELHAKYFRMPPNRRPNYTKLAVVSPFHAPFPQLVRDWLPGSAQEQAASSYSSYHVLRDRVLLQEIQLCLKRKQIDLPKEVPLNCLLQLHLNMNSRGSPNEYSLICLPTNADFKTHFKQKQRKVHDAVHQEPLVPDLREEKRKKVRLEHKKLLKRLRAHRLREKRKQQETFPGRVLMKPAGTSQLVAAHCTKMSTLWLNEDCSTLYTVRKQCTREVFGYVTKAGFSYTDAKMCGVGYVTIEGLKQLLQVCRDAQVHPPMCLVRATHSRCYRFANFKVNLQLS